MMTELDKQPQVTSTIAGDDGEAMGKSQENDPKSPSEEIKTPADAGWYVAVVRVNCEIKIAQSIQEST